MVWPKGHPIEGQPIVIKDHQVGAINAYLENMQGINIVPTSGGKTLISGILAHKVQKFGRSILIVPSKDLVTQTEKDFINLGLDVGVFFGDRKELNKTHTICTWQSLENIYKGQYDISIDDFLDNVVCVMSDECFSADSLIKTPSGYKQISDMAIGDTIINYSEKEQVFKPDTVVNVFKNLTKSSTEKMYELEFDNGKKIKVTGNHKFLTDRGWIRADQLTNDDNIISI